MCDRYLEELEKLNLGASILESAIKISLDYLDSQLVVASDLFPPFSMSTMYTSFSLLEKQQWISVSLLAPMWGVDDVSAERITALFSSISLGKASVQKNSAGLEEVGLKIQDLHQDFRRQHAQNDRTK